MKVLAFVHMGAPHHNAGAELMLHTMCRDLVRRRHEVRVLLQRTPATRMYVHQEVTYSPARDHAMWFDWCDVAITHLDCTRVAAQRARSHHKPIVHIVHNDRQLAHHGVTPAEPRQLVVFNSRWIADKVRWPGASIVVRPPVHANEYKTAPGDALTLVNLSRSKGAEIFYELARRLPGAKFLGVRGAYGHQVFPRPPLQNLEIIDNTPTMREVYGRTRILLMPSDYESWGRVAVEAAASGIPTIAHPTPGLLESLGRAGIFARRENLGEWTAALAALSDPKIYAARSAASRARSAELDPSSDLALFERSLRELVG